MRARPSRLKKVRQSVLGRRRQGLVLDRRSGTKDSSKVVVFTSRRMTPNTPTDLCQDGL